MSTTQVTDRILVHNVDSTISENQLRKQLLTSYHGIKHVQRLYKNDEHNTPKEKIQIDFTSPKHTATFFSNGFIDIGNLRCPVTALKSSMHLRSQAENDNGSDCQSEIFSEEQQVTNKILVHDVSTKIPVNELGEKLSKVYCGIKHVKRWYQRNGSEVATERVQIDFVSSADTRTILQDGFIHVGDLYWPVTGLKPSNRIRKQLECDDYVSDYQREIFSEQQILEVFEEQKQRLNELMHHFDVKLNNIVQLQNKSGGVSSSA